MLICENSRMTNKTDIEIEQLDWVAIPPQLEDGPIVRQLTKKQLRNWALVLQARQIPCRSEQGTQGRQILVPIDQFREACEELRKYEIENRNWPPPLPTSPPQQENRAATIWVLILLAIFHNLTLQKITLFGHPVDWMAQGNAQAGKILAGEWWRLVTALTLHSGALHLAGNMLVGGIFMLRLCRDLGSGTAWNLVLAAGALGNLVNALLQSPNHRSIGASTAVFGAVGILAAINMLHYRINLRNRWPLPIAAALGLLAMLGAAGDTTDLGAHLFGLLAGIALGLTYKFFLSKLGQPNKSTNSVLVSLAIAVISYAWFTALK